MTALAKSRAPQEKTTRSDTNINVRVPLKVRNLIDTAASVIGKTRTEFVLDSAKQHAIDVLLDRRLFSLPDSQYEAFLAVLDSPPPPVQKLRDLFNEKAPWEQ
jgi:uncharacterized protein (DUF1778 family)